MKPLFRMLMLAAISLSITPAYSDEIKKADSVAQMEPIAPINTNDHLALHGYDAVSYFREGKPEVGHKEFVYQWQGAEWRFASAAHRDAFKAEPQSYAPQFGGYCSYAASLGKVADADPQQWAVVNGKLFLNNNPRAQSAWDQDRPGNIALGNKNWPLIPKKAIVAQ